MNKPKGLLSEISIKRTIPRRWHKLYYETLRRLDYENLPPEKQMIADGLAFEYVQFAEAREMMRDEDRMVGRNAPDFAGIQKRILNWLTAWNAIQRNNEGDLAKQLEAFTEKNAEDLNIETC